MMEWLSSPLRADLRLLNSMAAKPPDPLGWELEQASRYKGGVGGELVNSRLTGKNQGKRHILGGLISALPLTAANFRLSGRAIQGINKEICVCKLQILNKNGAS
jgi:hypothetical protein